MIACGLALVLMGQSFCDIAGRSLQYISYHQMQDYPCLIWYLLFLHMSNS